MQITRIATVVVASLSLSFVVAQLRPGESPRSFRIPGPLADQGKYLAALNTLVAAKAELDKDPVEQGVYPYVHASLLTNLVLQDRALQEAFGPRLPDADFANEKVPALDDAQRVDAVRAIGRESDKTRVVILNEWHHVSQHRAFGLQVARELWKHGYRYLAAEALTENDTLFQPNGYPKASVGYIGDPLFGDFLRQAKRIGFKLVRYEAPTAELVKQKPEERNAFRDRTQAENIKSRALADPAAKVFVYCGGDHLVEPPITVNGQVHRRMASYLKEITGIDPLTVDQLVEQNFPDKEVQIPFRYAQRRGWVPRPTVFRTAEGKYWTSGPMKDRVDMMVFHPAPSQTLGRPAWIAMGGYRKPVRVPESFRPTSGRRMVAAMVKGEPSNSVPMDVVVLPSTGDLPALFLPWGEYELVLQDEAGNVLDRRSIRQR